MTTEDWIYQKVAETKIPKFFVTVEFSIIAEQKPEYIEEFLHEKYEAIQNGIKARKFVYQKDGWRMIFTFFPTDRVVEERYALKNKVFMSHLPLSMSQLHRS